MIDHGKKNVLGVLVNAVDYDTALHAIIAAAHEGRSFAATALAVHGIVTGLRDKAQRHRLNHLDLVTPDGQPVRWMLNLAYHAALADRVYGPTLMLRLCEAAAREGLPVYFYGTREPVVNALARSLFESLPRLVDRRGRALAVSFPGSERKIRIGLKDSLLRRPYGFRRARLSTPGGVCVRTSRPPSHAYDCGRRRL